MPRKSAGTLVQQRNDIKRRYKRGKKTEKRITSEGVLTEVDREVKRQVACYLKAADFSYTYIADALNLGKDVVKKWFAEDVDVDGSTMHAKVKEISDSYVEGAVKLLKTYAIELIEMLVELARRTNDDRVALQAITECLDRMGISKVNKSESVTAATNRSEVDVTDKTGLMEALREAPPEVQQAAAQHMADLTALAEERTR